jgi:pyruvate ferredoxin oxidoreductase gamma subunit/phenylglyoxylate dehydrogenase gamma subunit
MFEIRIHGRGGQGAVLASSILAQAFVDEGKYVIAIPSFGFERRGAPVSACLRVDDREIRALTNIYRPDCVICIDPTLPRMVDIFAGLKPGGTLVQATARTVRSEPVMAGEGTPSTPSLLPAPQGVDGPPARTMTVRHSSGGSVVPRRSAGPGAASVPPTVETLGLCDAVGIALEIFGKPITNSIMLGAFARTTGMVSLNALMDALEFGEFRDAGLAQNRRAMQRGYAETEVLAPEAVA